jgi:hypothetical protein
MLGVADCLMGKGMPLEVAPSALDVAQLRSLLRQPFGDESWPGVESLAGMYGAIIEEVHDGLGLPAGSWPMELAEACRQRNEVAASPGSARRDDKLAPSEVERAGHRDLTGLAGRFSGMPLTGSVSK